MKVYLAQYNPMIFESSFETLSIHKSRQSAEKVIANHKKEKIKEWQENKEWERKEFPELEEQYLTYQGEYDQFIDWRIEEQELLD